MINLIGINGEIGAGKDTMGKMIQWHTQKHGLFPTPIENYIKGDEGQAFSEWKIKKFAGKLKKIASLLTGIPEEKFEDQEFKKTFLPKEWDRYIPNFFDGFETRVTVREFLQKLGTEGIRNGVHTNAWVNALFADYKPVNGKINKVYWTNEDFRNDTITVEGEVEYPKWIITDTRFPNEAHAIKDKGGIVIRVVRTYPILEKWEKEAEEKGVVFKEESKHPSEIALNNWSFDYSILNDGSIEDLTKKVKEMLIWFNIIS